jgi:methionyl-tRNA synthetase
MHNITPQQHADQTVRRFLEAWKHLDIQYDDFIRTTEPRHKKVVSAVLQQLFDQGDIYKAEYEGWYCVSDERFWTEKDLVDNCCPECGRPVHQIAEANYFFRMSQYQEWLIDYIQTNPDFIQPQSRRNEILGFLRQPLNDLCISRPKKRLGWGITLPFDEDYVTYVWFDALLNYITAPGYLVDAGRFGRLWPQAIHLIGKDILTTHSVYWPTMLKAAGLPLPKTIFGHGWWVVSGLKMGKSMGNAVKPLDLADLYGVDALRYFLIRNMNPTRDAEFSVDTVDQRYQADLANNLGNLLNRIVSMIGRFCDGRIPTPGQSTEAEIGLIETAESLPNTIRFHAQTFTLHEGLEKIMAFSSDINTYLEQTGPWREAKKGNNERVATILYRAANALLLVSVLLHPVMPGKTAELWQQLGWQPPEILDSFDFHSLQPGTQTNPASPLFPRIEVDL